MIEHTPLTEEERGMLADLAYRDALDRWHDDEAARIAELAHFVGLEECVEGVEHVIDALEGMETNEELPQEIRERAARVRLVLGIDMRAITARMEALAVPAEMPVAPSPPSAF